MIRRSTRRTFLMRPAPAGTAGSFLQGGAPTHARTLRDSPKDKRPFTEMLHDEMVPGSGLLLVGQKGLSFLENDHGAKHVLLPRELFKGVKDCGFDQFPVSVGPSGWPGSPPSIPATLARPGSDPAPDPKKPEKILPRVGGRHFKEFVEAIKSNEPSKPMSNLDSAGRRTNTILQGVVALQAGGKIEWDTDAMRAKNNPDADQYIRRHDRGGFSIHP